MEEVKDEEEEDDEEEEEDDVRRGVGCRGPTRPPLLTASCADRSCTVPPSAWE